MALNFLPYGHNLAVSNSANRNLIILSNYWSYYLTMSYWSNLLNQNTFADNFSGSCLVKAVIFCVGVFSHLDFYSFYWCQLFRHIYQKMTALGLWIILTLTTEDSWAILANSLPPRTGSYLVLILQNFSRVFYTWHRALYLSFFFFLDFAYSICLCLTYFIFSHALEDPWCYK